MRMEPAGPSAADLVNRLPEAALADILFQYGEERASRRIARAIVADRGRRPFATTLAARRADRAAAAAAEARPAACGDAELPGAQDRGQRRARRARARARRRRGGAGAGRVAGGRHLPLARGPDREALPAAPLGRRAARQPACAGGGGRGAAASRWPRRKAIAAGRGRGRGQSARALGEAARRAAARRAGRRRSIRAALGLPPLALEVLGMRLLLHLSAAVLVVVCATWAYRVNYATQEALGPGRRPAPARSPTSARRSRS